MLGLEVGEHLINEKRLSNTSRPNMKPWLTTGKNSPDKAQLEQVDEENGDIMKDAFDKAQEIVN